MVNAMDIFGMVFVGLVFIGSLFVSFYIYVFMSHPLDRDFPGIWIVRAVIVLGMTISFMMAFILPVDFLSTYEL